MSERDVINQVDALINRHRALPAGQMQGDEDIPVLTEVVDLLTGNIAESVDSTPDIQAEMRAALARELEAWLDEKLPEAVLRVLDGLSDQMISQVAAQARLELLPRLKSTLESGSKSE